MKKIIFITVAAATIFAGCDIERLPENALAAEVITQDPLSSMDAALNGCYVGLKNSSEGGAWYDYFHYLGENPGDNLTICGSSTGWAYTTHSYKVVVTNGGLNSAWNASYKVIAQASNIIKAVPEPQSDEVTSKLGECYFLRGMMYFYLVRAFGRPYYDNPETNLGVPIVNGTPDDVINLKLPDRSTVKATYEQAIGDLEKAIALFGDKPDRGNSYASKSAAQALLSRIYLYMSGKYDSPNREYAQLAIDYADAVINSDKFSLLPRAEFMRYNTLTPDANKESIFVIRRLASEYSGYNHYYGVGGMYAEIGGMGWAENYASQKYMDLLDETGRNLDFSASASALQGYTDKSKLVDARAAFVEPQYDPDGKDVFRFARKVYNAAGTHTGYKYEQLDTITHEDKLCCTYTVDGTTFYRELTAVDAAQGRYSVEYDDGTGRVYGRDTGYIDRIIKLGPKDGHPMFFMTKCSREGEESHLHSPVITRLGEVYLNKAEAHAKLGEYGAALTALNAVRERSLPGKGRTSLDAGNAEQLIEKERTLELLLQAERGYDVFRNGGTLTRHYPGSHDALEEIPASDYRAIFYIPQTAINNYPAGSTLTQNPTSN